MEIVRIERILFPGKNPDMKEVERYLNTSLEQEYIVGETKEIIKIGSKFTSEYCGSNYTKKLRGALLKAKANAATIIPELINTAYNRRWIENKAEKHNLNASKGWYRYDVCFAVPIYDNNGIKESENVYTATLVARINDYGIYLYDLINIKKKRVSRLNQNDRTVEKPPLFSVLYEQAKRLSSNIILLN